MEDNKKNKEYKGFIFGFSIIKAENANWNADFTGYPRTLPDGMVFATDKAYKYAIRRYWHDVLNEDILMWRTYKNEGKDKGKPESLRDKHIAIKKKFKLNSEDEDFYSKIISKIFDNFIDVRMFGVTYTPREEKISFNINGPCQITYGVNKYNNTESYLNKITAPKTSGNKNKKNKDETKDEEDKTEGQFTIGSEARLTEAHYVYDFSINPNNISKDEFLKAISKDENNTKPEFYLYSEDIDKIKEAFRLSPSYLTSTPKIGVNTGLLFWVETRSQNDAKLLVPNLKNLVEIKDLNETDSKSQSSKRIVNLEKIYEYLKTINLSDKYSIELFYDPYLYDLKEGDIKKFSFNIDKRHIITGDKIE
jgi:CRISPR-associated protein Csh2